MQLVEASSPMQLVEPAPPASPTAQDKLLLPLPVPKLPKRHRPSPPPYHRVLKATGGQRLRVRLTAAGEAVCPLTMGPAAEDELDFLPGVTYLPGMDHIRLMTLPCQHAFGAMSLLYHFARHNMLCPCCRRGVSGRISATSIPAHVRGPVVQRVAAAARQDQQEQTAADAEAARLLGRPGDAVPAQLLIQGDGVQVAIVLLDLVQEAWASPQDLLAGLVLRVLVHTAEDASPPHLSFDYRLLTDEDTEGRWPLPPNHLIRFEMPLTEHRRFAAHLAETDAQLVSFIVHAPCVSGRTLMLARTEPIPVRLPAGVQHDVHLRTSRFTLHPRPGSDALSHVVWAAEAQTFEPLMVWYT